MRSQLWRWQYIAFHTQDWLNTRLQAGVVKLDGSGQAVMIGQRQSRDFQAPRGLG